jgi:small subunit ribosomal protein S18
MTKKMKLKVSARLLKKKSRRGTSNQKKQCRFCAGPEQEILLNYKNAYILKHFLTERGKILPSRISGNCAFHQRSIGDAIKCSRTMALLPYCSSRY